MDDAFGLQEAETSEHLASEATDDAQRESREAVCPNQLVQVDAEAW